jgi:uncharacterized membrane protein
MKKTEKITFIMLAIISVVALVAIVLQILNEKTSPLETTYEIITFSVALIAVMLAVLQGLANARTTRELHKIAHDIRESLREIHVIEDGVKKSQNNEREE